RRSPSRPAIVLAPAAGRAQAALLPPMRQAIKPKAQRRWPAHNETTPALSALRRPSLPTPARHEQTSPRGRLSNTSCHTCEPPQPPAPICSFPSVLSSLRNDSLFLLYQLKSHESTNEPISLAAYEMYLPAAAQEGDARQSL